MFFYKIINGMLPDYLYSYLEFPSQDNCPLRSASKTIIHPIPSRTKTFKNTFYHFALMNGIILRLRLGMLNLSIFLKN